MKDKGVTTLPVDKIRIDGGTQARERISEHAVEDYAQAIADGASFPPVDVFFDGKEYWLADGYHRHAAHRKAERPQIAARVHKGTADEALLFGIDIARKNTAVRWSPKRDAKHAAFAIFARPGIKKSDRAIAEIVGVSAPTVGKWRSELSTVNTLQSSHREGADGRVINTANIGKRELPSKQDLLDLARKADVIVPTWATKGDVESLLRKADVTIPTVSDPEVSRDATKSSEVSRHVEEIDDGAVDCSDAQSYPEQPRQSEGPARFQDFDEHTHATQVIAECDRFIARVRELQIKKPLHTLANVIAREGAEGALMRAASAAFDCLPEETRPQIPVRPSLSVVRGGKK